MALFVAPKTWAINEILASDDLNDLTAAIAASANAVVNAQVAANAAIVGTKLANSPDGVPTAKLNDLTVTTQKMAVGAAVAQVLSASAGAGSFNGTSGEVTIIEKTGVVVSRNGTILVFATSYGNIEPDTTTRIVQHRLLRINGGTVELANVEMAASDFNSNAGQHALGLVLPIVDASPGAGTYTYRLVASLTTGGVNDVVTQDQSNLLIVELA